MLLSKKFNKTLSSLVLKNVWNKQCQVCRLGPCLIEKLRYSTLGKDSGNENNTNSLRKNGRTIDNSTSSVENFKKRVLNGPNLKDFVVSENVEGQVKIEEDPLVPYLENTNSYGMRRKVYFEVYGCQMNVNDTEIVWSILQKHNFIKTDNQTEADIILIVTCAIRESAEARIWGRLDYFRGLNKARSRTKSRIKVGLLGCMAERLKQKVLEKDQTVDVVAGPDSYRDLPRLLALTENDQKSVNVLLSLDETYADIMPVRLNENSVSAFVSIMRGCDNMCTYCIVPFTRGRERSRPIDSILREVEQLSKQGVKEVTLLGQNVNSYRDTSQSSDFHSLSDKSTSLARGFRTVYRSKIGGRRFADLLEKVAEVDPEMRIRFTSPHPKDFPDEVLEVIKARVNICKNLHMPAQSGNSQVLERMRRGYTREAYLDLVDHIRKLVPEVSLSSDFICGFCGETDEEFEDTITLMEQVKYNTAYLFPYSMREKTAAHRRYKDDVASQVKQKRLERMIDTYRYHVEKINRAEIGKIHLILIEGFSKRSRSQLAGRNNQNIKVIITSGEIPEKDGKNFKQIAPGDYVAVQINNANSQVLKGIPLYHTTLTDFYLGGREQLSVLSMCS